MNVVTPSHPDPHSLALAYLTGHQLPQRWAGRSRFVMLEATFGRGHGFLALWAAWKADARRCEHLYFLSCEEQPLQSDVIALAHAHGPLRLLANELAAQWPLATADMHLLEFEQGRVRLQLARGETAQVLRQWIAQVDGFCLDSKTLNLPATADLFHTLQPLARLAAPGATLTAACGKPELMHAVARLGFVAMEVAAQPFPFAMTAARFAPHHPTKPPPGRRSQAGVRRVAVVGAGLAGSAAAAALARQGLEVVVLEARAPASGASGNPAGLYHPVLHGADSLHARWFRACALLAHRRLQDEPFQMPAKAGLLRLETQRSHAQMRALLQAQQLPDSFARALDQAQASALAGTPLPGPAWWFATAGAASPAAQVAKALSHPGIRVQLDLVHGLRQLGDSGPWALLSPQQHCLLQADAVVLANAGDALRLLGREAWPQSLLRGQITWLPAAAHPGLPLPALPVSGDGYALALQDALLCGATSQPQDMDEAVRTQDHVLNLQRAARLLGVALPPLDDLLSKAQGRTGWRVVVNGRLPVIGPVPAAHMGQLPRSDAPRLYPRVPGLYVLSALGSRGLSQAPLAGEILTSWITGAPQPVPARLLDAVDVARFARPAQQPGGNQS